MIQPKFNRRNNIIFLGFEAIEIDLVYSKLQDCGTHWIHLFSPKSGMILVWVAVRILDLDQEQALPSAKMIAGV